MSGGEAPVYSQYDDPERVRARLEAGQHRQMIGGLWEELGELQFDFLKGEGLKPHHRFIDVGCGTFRAGVKLAAYLDPGLYYGTDIREELIQAGYEKEIVPAGLAGRLPLANLRAEADFDLTPFGVMFDYGIAQSVFTHMPIRRLTDCLDAMAPSFAPGGRFYVTYFLRPDDVAPGAPVRHDPGGVESWPDRDPYHVSRAELEGAVPAGWRLEIIDHWNHPRDQRMARLIREG